jgi:hypothetical protein
MRISRRTAVIAACLLVGIIAVSALGSRLSIDADAYKSQFETAASDPLGLRVSVGGGLRVAFNGDVILVLRDVHVRNSGGAEVLSAERATIGIALLPLLFNECHIHRIALTRPRISIERGRDGVLNWARRAKPRGTPPVLARARLSLLDGSVNYKNEASGAVLGATGVNAEVRGLRKEDREVSNSLGRLSFRAKLGCKEIQTGTVSITDVSVVASAKKGTVELNPIAMRVFGGKGLASLRAELSDSVPGYRLRCTLSQFRIDECLRTLSPDTIATGAMDFSANVSLSGRAPAEWTRSLEGDVILRGQQIKLHRHDLDQEFSQFESSQNLDLADVGSFFFVGPLGMVVTKGYDFARLIGHSEGSTQIGAIVSSWDVKDGELQANDVAMATSKNRMALRGRLDFVRQRFDSVTIALIDKDGCAKVRQELRGTFQKPELTKSTLLGSLLGPARKVFTRVKDLLPGKCTAFYEGSVKHPE